MIPPTEDATAAVLQANFHVAIQNENPLVVDRAMELAAKIGWAVTQLVTTRSHQCGQLALRCPLAHGDAFLAKFCSAIGIGEKNNFLKFSHGVCTGL
jgi:hypothetical protein